MTRDSAVAFAKKHFDDGGFKDVLARRIAIPTESQSPDRVRYLESYISTELKPAFEAMGFTCAIWSHENTRNRFLYAERLEDESAVTVVGYGHGDVVHGLDEDWSTGLTPWELRESHGLWYGRGVADNKGQHTVNMEAIRIVLEQRGRLGFNMKYIVEMGEEIGSPGLKEVCEAHRDVLRGDLMIASDGPRVEPQRPALVLGSRGCVNMDLAIYSRKSGHHSGHWGGAISNPAIQLAHAIACITSEHGVIRIPEWVPERVPDSVRRVLQDCKIDGGPEGPLVDVGWGEPGFSPTERTLVWSSFEVLAFEAGTPRTPVNAVPPRAWARCQLRFVVGVDSEAIIPALRRHLDRHGFQMVKISLAGFTTFHPTRMDVEDPWVKWVAKSLERTVSKAPTIIPNQGGSLPNEVFANALGLRTIWVPHSYLGCAQHAPNEHLPRWLLLESLLGMVGLYWDLGEGDNLPAR